MVEWLRTVVVLSFVIASLARAEDSQPPSPPAGEAKARRLLESADEIAKKVAILRGLRIKREVRKGVMNRQQLEKRLLRRIEQEYSKEELLAEEALLKRFGLLQRNQSYLELVVRLLKEQIAGFYDPWEGRLYIASQEIMGGRFVMAHEIGHALQDQHFRLRSFMGSERHESDARAARQALVEGDGMAIMLEFMLSELGQPTPWGNPIIMKSLAERMSASSGGGGLDKAPLFLREGLVFPYLRGIGFIAHFRKRAPWKRVDKMYRRPPASTEQILHPKLYESNELPDEVKPIPGGTFLSSPPVHHDVFGELGFAIWLRQHGVARSRAELAAAGWGGDRVAVFEPSTPALEDERVGIVTAVWDSEADAIEFEEATLDAVTELVGSGRVLGSGRDPAVVSGRTATAGVLRRGDVVVVVIAGKSAPVANIAVEAFDSAQIRRR